MKSITIKPAAALAGHITIPGDKSISHRALLIGALADGEVKISGFLRGEDPLATLNCLRQLGVEIVIGGEKDGGDVVVVSGMGGKFKKPEKPLCVGNSGTTIRILSGILAAQSFDCEIYGDASIARRPMRRIVEPLSLMGAKIEGKESNGQIYPPLKIFGRKLQGINYKLPVASAQVKSALLLAGLLAEGETVIEEPALSRDHTERMLSALGVKLRREWNKIYLEGPQKFAGDIEIFVPGDISSAAFFMVAAAIVPEADLLLRNIGLNPTRTGILEVLHRMGAPYEGSNEELLFEEPRGDIRIQNPKSQIPNPKQIQNPKFKIQKSGNGNLRAIEIGGVLIPRLIDEIPIIAVLATQAEGRTVVRDAQELRVKESDRIATVCTELNKMGAQLVATEDGMLIEGPTRLHGAKVNSYGDHRLAMALSVAALCAEGETRVDDVECVETSFPGFFEVLKRACQ